MDEFKKSLGSRIDYILSRLDNLETYLIQEGHIKGGPTLELLDEIKKTLKEIGQ